MSLAIRAWKSVEIPRNLLQWWKQTARIRNGTVDFNCTTVVILQKSTILDSFSPGGINRWISSGNPWKASKYLGFNETKAKKVFRGMMILLAGKVAKISVGVGKNRQTSYAFLLYFSIC